MHGFVQVPCEPAYVSAEEDYEQYARCKQAQLDSLAHCHEILDFLRDDLNLPGSYFGNPDPEGDTYENPLLTLPASWQPAGSKAPVLIGAAKQSDVERAYLCSLQSTLTAASVEPEEAAVAAAELQALELRLETAEAALCAWLEAGEAKHPEIPPLTLNQLKDNSSGLALFEEVLLRPWDTTTTSLRFIPIQASSAECSWPDTAPCSHHQLMLRPHMQHATFLLMLPQPRGSATSDTHKHPQCSDACSYCAQPPATPLTPAAWCCRVQRPLSESAMPGLHHCLCRSPIRHQHSSYCPVGTQQPALPKGLRSTWKLQK